MSNILLSVRAECDACNGTGVYKGYCERQLQGRECRDCHGKGWKVYNFWQFTGRRYKPGISSVIMRDGSEISYGDFQRSVLDGYEGGELLKITPWRDSDD